ncbi:hypothetical protein [Amycolatopsis sp. cg13]|uniref:hypothetical protein n=1 Tax=Amycolatopsis sp. cg13 TaxID=3238807 RepID=UPI003524C216
MRAGERRAAAGIAGRSALDDSFLRRDYLTADAYRFHVDANLDIDEESPFSDEELTPAERRDLVRHRCAVRRSEHLPQHENPVLDWRLTVPRK